MYRSSDNATVWGVIVAAILLGVIFISQMNCTPSEVMAENGRKNALAYARDLELVNPHASCTGGDSDGDGNVSCVLRADNHEETHLECRWRDYEVGCKPWTPEPIKIENNTTIKNTTTQKK